ncbi:MAG: hypothetical protein R6U39_05105 [Candidatus Aegiribacteria sp.]
MSGFLQRLLKVLGIGGRDLKRLNRTVIHLPADLRDPDGLVIFSGPMESDVWPALFLANSLQKEFQEVELNVICPERDHRLFNMLSWRPSVHRYVGKPRVPGSLEGEKLSSGTLFFYPYSKVIESDRDILLHSKCGIRIAPLDERSRLVNLTVMTKSPYFPEKLEQMCGALGLSYHLGWKPVVREHARRAAEQKMAPVTGRMLPYIVTTATALGVLEKNRAEVPLRTVCLSGKNTELSGLDREMKTAIVAGASVVATDSDDLWGDACAFEVPVVGLDREGNFMKWHGVEASRQEADFVDAWVKLLKRGW